MWAKQTVAQDIPIHNQSSGDWTVQARLSGGGSFSGPSSLTVPAKSKAVYPVRFRPAVPGKEEAALVLSNSTTGDEYKYTLVSLHRTHTM
jgi:hypothetical protein